MNKYGSPASPAQYGVVPFGMNFVTANPQFLDLLQGDFDPCLVPPGIEHRFHSQPASGSRPTNQIDHRFEVPKRLPFPRQTDEREDPMLDPVPLAGSRRIMTHRDRNSDLVHQLQPIRFPGVGATAIAATPIRTNQQLSGGRITPVPVQPPPPPDTLHRKFCRVVV